MALQISRLAEKIVYKDCLKNPQMDRRAKAEQRIVELVEFDERMKTVKNFCTEWNKWREFYFDLSPILPKNKNQLTMIETAIAFTHENNLKLPMMIACVHRAFQKRNYRPNYNEIMTHGLDYYERYYDDVIADISRAEYERDSLNRG